MKPPFGRMGGKRLLALRIINLFPDNYDVFVEPFLGAGNIFFRLKHNPEEVYDAIKNIKGKFLLSYNDSPKIRDIFKKYDIQTIKTDYQPTKDIKKRTVKELLIKNY